MIEHGAPFQRREITACLFGSVSSLSCQLYGCRVVQRAVELSDLDQKIQIAKELNSNIMKCIHDPNANHVVQKCIEHVPPRFIQFFVESMYGRVVELSVHPYGCRVIQRILEYFDSSIQEIFLEEIIEEVYYMAKDQYANYVVQNILQHGKALVRSAIIKKFIGRVVAMSKQKFASNVIEKCLIFGSYDEKQKIINEVIGTTDLVRSGETEALVVMVNDQYANYVVQKVIETCDEWQRKLILRRLRAHHSLLHDCTYAKHVVARLDRLIDIGERKMANPRRPRRHGKDPVPPLT
jgi:pumilio RNA-binding family